jgi:nucleotide-binding universal stress UspA family protein
MYNTILVPLDGSKRAERILPHVERLAVHYNAKLIFLQVVEPPPLIVGPEGDITLHQQEIDRLVKKAEDYLAATKGEFQKRGIEIGTHVVHGPVVEAIITTAEREGADLIAIASHGRSGLSQVFYGSVAAGVLQRIDRPLLLIRSQGDE